MIIKLLTEHHLEFLSLKGGCRGSSESTHVKMPNCWKSHALAQIEFDLMLISFHEAKGNFYSFYPADFYNLRIFWREELLEEVTTPIYSLLHKL